MKKLLLTALFFGLLSGHSFAQFKFAPIDVPNSMATWASGIGPGGQIVGGYMDANNVEHGYLYGGGAYTRSEEHTSELQSPYDLVCRLLLDKKNPPIHVPRLDPRVAFRGLHFSTGLVPESLDYVVSSSCAARSFRLPVETCGTHS